jgi:PhnB protein
MAVENPPKGHEGVTPYLSVRDADRAIAWYGKVLGATCGYRMEWGGKVGHADLAIGGARFMLSEEYPDRGSVGPQTLGGTSVSLLLYVPDVDATMALAVAEGATEERPASDQPWGDRSGWIVDPFGHRWTLATHQEDVSNEELDRRFAAMAEG